MKALVLEKQGNAAEAQKLRAEAFTIATEAELNNYGYQLLGEHKVDEAIAIFDRNVKAHPQSWNTYDSLGEAYGIKGDKKKAIELYTRAQTLTADDAQKTRIAGVIDQLRKQ